MKLVSSYTNIDPSRMQFVGNPLPFSPVVQWLLGSRGQNGGQLLVCLLVSQSPIRHDDKI